MPSDTGIANGIAKVIGKNIAKRTEEDTAVVARMQLPLRLTPSCP